MPKIQLHYHKKTIPFAIDNHSIKAILTSNANVYQPLWKEEELIRHALANPIGTNKLSDLVVGKKHVAIISSDHTRPVPSAITMPIILDEIKRANPNIAITIIVATGMHRRTTDSELIDKYGKEIFEKERILVHEASIIEDMVFKGILPSGGELWLNKIVDEADLLIAEGFIEPHFFAGFSGGRKSVLPGIASEKTVLWNHNARFIANKQAKSGQLKNNPIHEDMIYAAKKANLAFIINVVLNDQKEIINCFTGDVYLAHQAGTNFVEQLASVKKVTSDIVITTNGGYPLDQNIYQSVKGIKTAYQCCNPGGVIIMVASCSDGIGGDHFYHLLADYKTPHEAHSALVNIPPEETKYDQWQAQILANVLVNASVIFVTEHISHKIIEDMHMHAKSSIEDALNLAYELLGKKSEIVLIPDGINVIIKD